jgi:hypothetical protein
MRVIPIGKHLARAPQQLVQPLGEPDRQPLHTPRQRSLILRLDDQVHVIVLEREVA